jgi:type IV pilus assembly protein PilB
MINWYGIHREKESVMATQINKQPHSVYSAANGHTEITDTDLLNLSSQREYNIPVFSKKLTSLLLKENGSDLHLAPDDGKHHILIRRNGVLEPLIFVDEKTGKELTNYWKVLAGLDLTLTNRPQDGSILNSKTGGASYRVSTCPTLFGEKVVIRLHSSSLAAISVNELGMTQQQRAHYLKAIQNTSGLILVSGPTGSGKTNTLYAALKHLQKKPLSIVSIEDPIEVNLPGITQINVNKAFGFPDALRTILRQDPDVIMIGEIRDRETAEMAISAAQTGHLVLASIHAADCYGALLRLQDLGINLNQAIQQLQVLISQRLIRIKTDNYVSTDSSNRYHSRSGVFDLLPCSEAIQSQLLMSHEQKNLRKTIPNLIADTQETSDSILLQLIKNNKTDWTETQRVYGWEKVANLSAQSVSTSQW